MPDLLITTSIHHPLTSPPHLLVATPQHDSPSQILKHIIFFKTKTLRIFLLWTLRAHVVISPCCRAHMDIPFLRVMDVTPAFCLSIQQLSGHLDRSPFWAIIDNVATDIRVQTFVGDICLQFFGVYT